MAERTTQFVFSFAGVGAATAALVVLGMAQGTTASESVISAEQREILSHMSIVYLDDGQGGQAKTVRIEGVNIQVVNGLGATNGYPTDPRSFDSSLTETNGVGNLIIGYNELGSPSSDDRTGSHNLVVGALCSHSSFGGAAVGFNNGSMAAYAVAAGGTSNRSQAAAAATCGGNGARANGLGSVVVGGQMNTASGLRALVVGGGSNEAVGDEATVLGGGHPFDVGIGNRALGPRSVVVGGRQNNVTGDGAVVSGGCQRVASGDCDWVAGGLFEDQ